MDNPNPTDRMLTAADKVDNLELELATHEVQCEERWKTTFNRLDDIEQQLKSIANRIMIGSGSLIVFLGGVIISLLTR